MTLTWWRANLRLKPIEKYATHIFSNERNIISILGRIRVIVVQIADLYVNKIDNWVAEGDIVVKGERLGLIKMGSQVDTLLPKIEGMKVVAHVGQKVKAGESMLAAYEMSKED